MLFFTFTNKYRLDVTQEIVLKQDYSVFQKGLELYKFPSPLCPVLSVFIHRPISSSFSFKMSSNCTLLTRTRNSTHDYSMMLCSKQILLRMWRIQFSFLIKTVVNIYIISFTLHFLPHMSTSLFSKTAFQNVSGIYFPSVCFWSIQVCCKITQVLHHWNIIGGVISCH